MTDLDQESISVRIDQIRFSARTLKDILGRGKQTFLGDPVLFSAAEHNMQIASQAALDIAEHIITASGWEMAGSYRDVFRILGKHGILDRDLAENMMALAGLRNILVHLYLQVKPDEFYENIARGLEDLERYCLIIIQYLESLN